MKSITKCAIMYLTNGNRGERMPTLYELDSWLGANNMRLYTYDQLVKALANYNEQQLINYYSELTRITFHQNVDKVILIRHHYGIIFYDYHFLGDNVVDGELSPTQFKTLVQESNKYLAKLKEKYPDEVVNYWRQTNVFGKTYLPQEVQDVYHHIKGSFPRHKSHTSCRYGRKTQTGNSSMRHAYLFNSFSTIDLPLRHKNRHQDDVSWAFDDDKRIVKHFSTGWKHSTKDRKQYISKIRRDEKKWRKKLKKN